MEDHRPGARAQLRKDLFGGNQFRGSGIDLFETTADLILPRALHLRGVVLRIIVQAHNQAVRQLRTLPRGELKSFGFELLQRQAHRFILG
jgi:hypothetical protein